MPQIPPSAIGTNPKYQTQAVLSPQIPPPLTQQPPGHPSGPTEMLAAHPHPPQPLICRVMARHRAKPASGCAGEEMRPEASLLSQGVVLALGHL